MSDEINTLKDTIANQAAVITNLNVQVSNLNSLVANLSLNIQNLTERMNKYYITINEYDSRILQIEGTDNGILDSITNIQNHIERLLQLVNIGY